eukprot:384648_1
MDTKTDKKGYLQQRPSGLDKFDKIWCELREDNLLIFEEKEHLDSNRLNKYDLKIYDKIEEVENNDNQCIFSILSSKQIQLKIEFIASSSDDMTGWIKAITNAQSNIPSKDEEETKQQGILMDIEYRKNDEPNERETRNRTDLVEKMDELQKEYKILYEELKQELQEMKKEEKQAVHSLTLIDLEDFLPLLLLDKKHDGIDEDEDFVVNQYNQFLKTMWDELIMDINQYRKLKKFQGLVLKDHEKFEQNKNKLRR